MRVTENRLQTAIQVVTSVNRGKRKTPLPVKIALLGDLHLCFSSTTWSELVALAVLPLLAFTKGLKIIDFSRQRSFVGWLNRN